MVLVTLTYPGNWQAVAPTAKASARHLQNFRKRLERATGEPAYAIHKREFQKRGAPHFHLLLPLPPMVKGEPIREWLSRTWFEIVGSGDERHLVAGTGIDWDTGARAADPVRAAIYFAGYASGGGKASKGHQDNPPKLWLDAALDGADDDGVGRFWGQWSLKPAEERVDLTESEAIEVRRLMRRLYASRGRTRRVVVQRQRSGSGSMRYRTVRRRSSLPHLASRHLVGGSLFARDAPELAQALARYLRSKDVPDRLDPGRLP